MSRSEYDANMHMHSVPRKASHKAHKPKGMHIVTVLHLIAAATALLPILFR